VIRLEEGLGLGLVLGIDLGILVVAVLNVAVLNIAVLIGNRAGERGGDAGEISPGPDQMRAEQRFDCSRKMFDSA